MNRSRVARDGNLLYRRLAVGRRRRKCGTPEHRGALWIVNPRLNRLPVCATPPVVRVQGFRARTTFRISFSPSAGERDGVRGDHMKNHQGRIGPPPFGSGKAGRWRRDCGGNPIRPGKASYQQIRESLSRLHSRIRRDAWSFLTFRAGLFLTTVHLHNAECGRSRPQQRPSRLGLLAVSNNFASVVH